MNYKKRVSSLRHENQVRSSTVSYGLSHLLLDYVMVKQRDLLSRGRVPEMYDAPSAD
jgi:hypothetical protein